MPAFGGGTNKGVKISSGAASALPTGLANELTEYTAREGCTVKITLAQGIGIVAGFLTTISFVPQVLKVYQTKHTKDLSVFMLLLFCAGVSLWTVYGILLAEAPIIIPNAVTLGLAAYILAMKVRYK